MLNPSLLSVDCTDSFKARPSEQTEDSSNESILGLIPRAGILLTGCGGRNVNELKELLLNHIICKTADDESHLVLPACVNTSIQNNRVKRTGGCFCQKLLLQLVENES